MAVQSVKAKINGQTVNLTYNDGTGFWEATTTAPTSSSYNQPGHYYGVEITATDDSGNDTTINASTGDFQEECQLVVKEKVVPVITINSPTSGAHITSRLSSLVSLMMIPLWIRIPSLSRLIMAAPYQQVSRRHHPAKGIPALIRRRARWVTAAILYTSMPVTMTEMRRSSNLCSSAWIR